MELFYILREIERPGKIVISVLGEDHIRRKILTIRKGSYKWKKIFTGLPSGLNQIVIRAYMKKDFVQSVAIDDIFIAPCSEFSKVYFKLQYFLQNVMALNNYMHSLYFSQKKACI